VDDRRLEGLWTYTANEVGGERQTPEQVARLARFVVLPGSYVPEWHGLWAAVSYGYEGGVWSEVEVKASCRHIILGTEREGGAPGPDFYFWAGGRFRCAPERAPQQIDLEQFWRGAGLHSSLQLGLYHVEGDRLTLCLAEEGGPRPSLFTSDEHPYQSLSELVRG
jgi:uncharacterized protein (TIGR03067 family)